MCVFVSQSLARDEYPGNGSSVVTQFVPSPLTTEQNSQTKASFVVVRQRSANSQCENGKSTCDTGIAKKTSKAGGSINHKVSPLLIIVSNGEIDAIRETDAMMCSILLNDEIVRCTSTLFIIHVVHNLDPAAAIEEKGLRE